MTRKSWSNYWLDICEQVASRSTCSRLLVGTAIVSHDNCLIVAGYNGSLPGRQHCMDRRDPAAPGCCGCSHSEANAVSMAARRGTALKGATAYVTVSPCEACTKLLVMAGVSRIAYRRAYRITGHLEEAAAYGLLVEQVTDDADCE